MTTKRDNGNGKGKAKERNGEGRGGRSGPGGLDGRFLKQDAGE